MWLGEEAFSKLKGRESVKFRDLIVANDMRRCTKRRAYWVGDTQHLPPDDNIYRVHVDTDTGHVRVTCIGLESVDAIVDGNYTGTDKLPNWMQEKLAVLRMLSAKPPTEVVDGVGRRIDADIYWVFC
jgi:hypothetical protein